MEEAAVDSRIYSIRLLHRLKLIRRLMPHDTLLIRCSCNLNKLEEVDSILQSHSMVTVVMIHKLGIILTNNSSLLQRIISPYNLFNLTHPPLINRVIIPRQDQCRRILLIHLLLCQLCNSSNNNRRTYYNSRGKGKLCRNRWETFGQIGEVVS
jgi:hypothetical protein